MKKRKVLSVAEVRAELTENIVSLHNLHMENARRNKEGNFFKMVFGGAVIIHN